MNNKIVVAVFIGIVGVLLAIIAFYQKPAHFDGITAKQLMDSLNAHDKVREQQLSVLRSKYEQDSVKISSIRSEIDKVPGLVKEISKSYDKKRSHVNSLSVDEQVSHMSDWLSKDSSLGE
jgi:hypothetical protein